MGDRECADEERKLYFEDLDVKEEYSSEIDEKYQPDRDRSEETEDLRNSTRKRQRNLSDSYELPCNKREKQFENLSSVPVNMPPNFESEWKSDILSVGRETFTGKAGIQNIKVITEDGKVSLIKIYEIFLTDEIIDDMVLHTNNYADLLKKSRISEFSRMNRWKNVSREEMKIFFGVIMYMGLIRKPSIQHYWKLDNLYYQPLMHRINMSNNRFTLILRCWQFADLKFGVTGHAKTHKIDPLLHKVVNNFRSLYTPPETIVLHESTVKYNRKSDYNGIKIHKACTVNTYTWSYQIYVGALIQLEGLDKPGSIVVQLVEPLLDEGRIIIADSYYTSVALAEYLKNRRTDLCGTINKNKRDLPAEVVTRKLRRGDVIARQKDNYLTVMKWRNTQDVMLISTCHSDTMSQISKKWENIMKPDAIIDYSDARKGIHISDQLSSFHFPLRKSLTWYKKIAIDVLFRVAVINARYIYNEVTDGPKLSLVQVQEQLIRHLLGPVALNEETKKSTEYCATTSNIAVQHHLEEIPRRGSKLVRKRCVGCYKKLKEQGELASRAKQVHTQCNQCHKAFCLGCFNKNHQ